MTSRDPADAALPAPDLEARSEAGLRERVWAKIRESETHERRRAERNARWLRVLWWFGPIVFVAVAILVVYLCTLAVRP